MTEEEFIAALLLLGFKRKRTPDAQPPGWTHLHRNFTHITYGIAEDYILFNKGGNYTVHQSMQSALHAATQDTTHEQH